MDSSLPTPEEEPAGHGDQPGEGGEFDHWTPPPELDTSASLPASPEELYPKPGDVIGGYQIEEEIGRGGMGIVFRATDEKGQRVAIKYGILPNRDPDRALKRFEKETRSLAQVNHPNVIRLIDLVHFRGQPLLVTDFIAGCDLHQNVQHQGPMDLDSALRLFLPLLEGLEVVHQAGLVHRDIKPGNILMSESGPVRSEPRGVLCDFGLARQIDQTDSMQLTSPGAVIGTPMYMAPEQLINQSVADSRSDVYSIAATLYFALTGQPPVDAAGVAELREIFQRPAHDSPSLELLTSEPLRRVLNVALRREPGNRFQSAEWFRQELVSFQKGQPTALVQLKPLPDHDRLTKKVNFHWTLASPLETLWEYLANTNLVNQALGLPAPEYSRQANKPPAEFLATAKLPLGALTWIEHPFQWIANQSHHVFREFQSGPFRWIESRVELRSVGEQVLLCHGFVYQPRGRWAIPIAEAQLRLQFFPKLNRLYQSIDRHCVREVRPVEHGAEHTQQVGPFTSEREKSQLQSLLERNRQSWSQQAGHAASVDQLIRVLPVLDKFQRQNLRPRELASETGIPLDRLFRTLLAGTQVGIFDMTWAVICPTCRVPVSATSQLTDLSAHSDCDFCNTRREIDYSRHIELYFRTRLGSDQEPFRPFCVGGPYRMPHVLVQRQIPAGKTLQLRLELDVGDYRIYGPQLPNSLTFSVAKHATAPFLNWEVGRSPDLQTHLTLTSPTQTLLLRNGSERELLIRVERVADRTKRFTLQQAIEYPDFGRWFPEQLQHVEHLHFIRWRAIVSLRFPEPPASHWLHTIRPLGPLAEKNGGQILVVDPIDEVQLGFDTFRDAVSFLAQIPGTGESRPRFAVSAGEVEATYLQHRPIYCGKALEQGRRAVRSVEGDGLQGIVLYSDPASDLPDKWLQIQKLTEAWQLRSELDEAQSLRSTVDAHVWRLFQR